jgi:hypothetical protein
MVFMVLLVTGVKLVGGRWGALGDMLTKVGGVVANILSFTEPKFLKGKVKSS